MQDPPFLTGLLLRLHVVGKLHLPGQVATQHGHCSSHYHGCCPGNWDSYPVWPPCQRPSLRASVHQTGTRAPVRQIHYITLFPDLRYSTQLSLHPVWQTVPFPALHKGIPGIRQAPRLLENMDNQPSSRRRVQRVWQDYHIYMVVTLFLSFLREHQSFIHILNWTYG